MVEILDGGPELVNTLLLPATLEASVAKDAAVFLDDADATELPDPLRLLEVEDVPLPPSRPEEIPSFAGLDSSGNRSPVLVIFESHMRW